MITVSKCENPFENGISIGELCEKYKKWPSQAFYGRIGAELLNVHIITYSGVLCLDHAPYFHQRFKPIYVDGKIKMIPNEYTIFIINFLDINVDITNRI